MMVPRDMLLVGRVLHEDTDFVTLEVGKHDEVEFTLQYDEEGEIVGGDRFFTLMFVNTKEGAVWNPFTEEEETDGTGA